MKEQQVTLLMSNEELDTWADIFVQAKVAELLEIPFSKFLEAPFSHIQKDLSTMIMSESKIPAPDIKFPAARTKNVAEVPRRPAHPVT